MPAEVHRVFIAPKNPNIKIWRYMDFTKYLSFLEKRALFFTRSDKFDDPYEGSTTQANVTNRSTVYKNASPSWLEQWSLWSRQWTYINCWHMNEYESAAMWSLYAKTNEAIAIQSTYQRLFDCLPPKTYVGKVHYIDYDKDWLPEGNTFFPYVHKRKSFEHEQELRAVIQEIPLNESGGFDKLKVNPESGRVINVDAQNLAEK